MLAAVIERSGEAPHLAEFAEPPRVAGHSVVTVQVAGLNPSDVHIANGMFGDLPLPRVPGNEGVGTVGGRRVYFERTVTPHGAMAPQAATLTENLIDVLEGLASEKAVACGISSLAGWLALEHTAKLQPRESVLVLGASGPVGQAATQAARILGASRVVAAARYGPVLHRLRDQGAADEIVQLGGADDEEHLRSAAEGGFDIIVDPLFGAPLITALRSGTPRARVVQLGMSSGPTATIPWTDLFGRSILTYSNLMVAHELKRTTHVRMMRHSLAGEFEIDVELRPLNEISELWTSVRRAPHAKLMLQPH